MTLLFGWMIASLLVPSHKSFKEFNPPFSVQLCARAQQLDASCCRTQRFARQKNLGANSFKNFSAQVLAFDRYPNEKHVPNHNIFIDFPNEYYVETGTSGGGSILRALGVRKKRPGAFRYIYSIDIDPQSIDVCQRQLSGYPNVKLRVGDSTSELWEMIRDISKPITFWLDAHRFPPEEDGKKNCPLLEELEQIGRHPIRTHTILIDDMSCCGTAAFDYLTVEQLIEKVLEINPQYQIKFLYSQILVAQPPR
ncbi:MAG: hypothetical protein KGJ02_05565 [Verrucomicrobiota bacterium]|nr:hypothetical protein [Verrucomicrobiota bacterium]